jgi:hypothetical protein
MLRLPMNRPQTIKCRAMHMHMQKHVRAVAPALGVR